MSYREFVRDRYTPGEMTPWWKGYVYHDFTRRETVVAPLILNVVFSILLELFYHVRRARCDAMGFNHEQNEIRKAMRK